MPQVPAEVLDRIIDYADYDGDGDIPYAEFVRVITAPDILNMRALYNTGPSEAVMAGTLTGERALQTIEDGQAEFLQTISMSHASRPDALRVTAPMPSERAWQPGSKTTLEAPPPLTPTSSQPGSPRQRLDMQGAWRSETGLNIQQIQAYKLGREINWRAGNSASPRENLFTLGPGEVCCTLPLLRLHPAPAPCSCTLLLHPWTFPLLRLHPAPAPAPCSCTHGPPCTQDPNPNRNPTLVRESSPRPVTGQ